MLFGEVDDGAQAMHFKARGVRVKVSRQKEWSCLEIRMPDFLMGTECPYFPAFLTSL